MWRRATSARPSRGESAQWRSTSRRRCWPRSNGPTARWRPADRAEDPGGLVLGLLGGIAAAARRFAGRGRRTQHPADRSDGGADEPGHAARPRRPSRRRRIVLAPARPAGRRRGEGPRRAGGPVVRVRPAEAGRDLGADPWTVRGSRRRRGRAAPQPQRARLPCVVADHPGPGGPGAGGRGHRCGCGADGAVRDSRGRAAGPARPADHHDRVLPADPRASPGPGRSAGLAAGRGRVSRRDAGGDRFRHRRAGADRAGCPGARPSRAHHVASGASPVFLRR